MMTKRQAGLTLCAVATAGVAASACSGGGGAKPKPFKLAIVQVPAGGALEQQTAQFTIASEDSDGNLVPFHGTVSVTGLGPLTPTAVGMSSAQLDVDVVFQLGGDNELTFAAPGLQPVTRSVYVGPVLPTQVLGPASAGSVLDAGIGWDAAGVWAPSVVFVGTGYRMYYASSGGGMGAGVGLAVSIDGLTFTRYGSGPIVGPGAQASTCHSVAASAPDVFRTGATWTMIYQGRGSGAPELCGATSTDGLTWTPSGTALAVSTSADAFDNVALRRFSAVELTNGSFAGLYGSSGIEGLDGPVYAVGLAVSPDGSTWMKTPGVLPDGSVERGDLNTTDQSEWQDRGTTDPSIERAGTVFRLWASGLGTPGGVWRVGRFAGLDLADMGEHLEGNTDFSEVIPTGPSMSFDDVGDMEPSVVTGPDGIRRVYFTGLRADGTRRIGLVEY